MVYNASNNELVRTKTLVKNCIVLVDSLPYRQWYEAHFATPLGRKKGAKLTPEEEEVLNKKRSKRTQKKYDERKKTAKISPLLEEQFQQGKLLGESEHVHSSTVAFTSLTGICISFLRDWSNDGLFLKLT